MEKSEKNNSQFFYKKVPQQCGTYFPETLLRQFMSLVLLFAAIFLFKTVQEEVTHVDWERFSVVNQYN
jgi:hypothetical protein